MSEVITKDQILDAVANMSVMDVCDLVSAMEDDGKQISTED